MQKNNEGNLEPPREEAIQQGEQKLLPQQVEENQFHYGLGGNGIVISNWTKQLGYMSSTNVDEKLNSMVD